MAKLPSSAKKVQEFLNSKGEELQVVELPESTRTAKEAAQAVGCDVGQIVKSLIFKGAESGRPVLVLASGPNLVDTEKIAKELGEGVGKADANFVRQETGFAIGGVPPVGHIKEIRTIMDEDLKQYGEIWAAAGTPQSVFRLTPEVLVRLSGAVVMGVK